MSPIHFFLQSNTTPLRRTCSHINNPFFQLGVGFYCSRPSRKYLFPSFWETVLASTSASDQGRHSTPLIRATVRFAMKVYANLYLDLLISTDSCSLLEIQIRLKFLHMISLLLHAVVICFDLLLMILQSFKIRSGLTMTDLLWFWNTLWLVSGPIRIVAELKIVGVILMMLVNGSICFLLSIFVMSTFLTTNFI